MATAIDENVLAMASHLPVSPVFFSGLDGTIIWLPGSTSGYDLKIKFSEDYSELLYLPWLFY